MGLSPRRETQHTLSSKTVTRQALLVVVAAWLGYPSASAAPYTTPCLDSHPSRATASGTPTDATRSRRRSEGGSGQAQQQDHQRYHTRQPRKRQASSNPSDADQSSAPIIATSALALGNRLDTRRSRGNARDSLVDGADSNEGSALSGFGTVAAPEAGEGYGSLERPTGVSSRRKRGKTLRGRSDPRRRRRRNSEGQEEAGLLGLGLNQVERVRSLQEASRSTGRGESQHAPPPSSSSAKTHEKGDKDEAHILHSAYGRSAIARRPLGLAQEQIVSAGEAMLEENEGEIDQHWLRFTASWPAGERSTSSRSRRLLRNGDQDSPSPADDDTLVDDDAVVDDDTWADDDESRVAEDSFGSVGILAFLVCFGLIFCVMEVAKCYCLLECRRRQRLRRRREQNLDQNPLRLPVATSRPLEPRVPAAGSKEGWVEVVVDGVAASAKLAADDETEMPSARGYPVADASHALQEAIEHAERLSPRIGCRDSGRPVRDF